MDRIALFPGSFDPMTTGHLALLRKAMPLFDRIIVAIGVNSAKKEFLPLAERISRIQKATADMPNIKTASYSGTTIDFCHETGAKFILRGVRNNADFEYERTIADINRLLDSDIETVILISEPQYAAISSTMVRELASLGKDVSKFVIQ